MLLSIAFLFSGVILFLVARKTLEQMGIFRGRQADVMALSIACLVVPSVAMFLLVPGGAGENGHNRLSVNFELLPGLAVSGIIVLLLSFVIAALTTPIRANEVPTGASALKPIKPKSPSRPKRREPESPPAPQKPGGKRKNEPKASSPVEAAATTQNLV